MPTFTVNAMDTPFLHVGKSYFDAVIGFPVFVLLTEGVDCPCTQDRRLGFGKEQLKDRNVLAGASVEEFEPVQ